jgi:hypothetical protein
MIDLTFRSMRLRLRLNVSIRKWITDDPELLASERSAWSAGRVALEMMVQAGMDSVFRDEVPRGR